MECNKALVVVLAGLAVGIGGCGKPSGSAKSSIAEDAGSVESTQATEIASTSAGAAAKADGPEAAVAQFLEAVRSGNDRTAEMMFTNLARERIKELGIQVAPKKSDTAKFEVSPAAYLASNGARVPCKWTDRDKDGNPHSDEMTWMLRKEPEGWRVAGMAAVVFEGENPLLLDFENPKETLQKMQMLQEEIARRSAPREATVQQQDQQSANPVRR